MPIRTFGTMAVDWEERVHFDRLREERLARIKAELKKSDIGALLCFDMSNIRYITNTTIGTWAIDKLGRFCLLPQDDEPINWDFGIAAKHHQMYCSWFKEGHSRAGISTLRGAMPPAARRAEDVARKIRIELEERGLHKEPLGVDVVEPPVLFTMVSICTKSSPGRSEYSFITVTGMLLSRPRGGIERMEKKPFTAICGSIGSKRSSGPLVWSTAAPPPDPSSTTVMLVGLSVDEMLMSGVMAR